MSTSNMATPMGTQRYRARFAGTLSDAHFRRAQDLWLSSIGLGTYLGQATDAADADYQAAIGHALSLGCNVLDTAANYRFQRSERTIGATLQALFDAGTARRDEIVIATKGGFVPFDNDAPRNREAARQYVETTFITPGICTWEDFVQGQHCMTPAYLAHQLAQSLNNLQLEAIDIYYLHNPETQLGVVDEPTFYARLRAAFTFLEQAVAEGKLAMYGAATWNGFRVPPTSQEHLSLAQMEAIAREVAGAQHHFKALQLPVNLAMTEAFTQPTQQFRGTTATVLEVASELGMTVMCSGSILQGRLATNLPPLLAEVFADLRTSAQRALQFVRSTPGVTTALIGMGTIGHVSENLELAQIAPAVTNDYLKLFDR